MCYASPGTRCTKKAREKLKEAKAILNSVDPNNVDEWLEANQLVRQETYEYSMSPSGMKELKAKAELTKLQSDLDIYENTKAVRDARNGISKKLTAQKKAEEAQKVEAMKAKDLKDRAIAKRNAKTLNERNILLAKNNEKLSQQADGNNVNMTGLKPIDTPHYLTGSESLNGYFDYETESSGCSGHCDDYCRCTYIVGSTMNTTVVPTREIMGHYLSCKASDVPEEYLSYAEKNFDFGNIDNYEINGVGGYYGQEAEVSFTRNIELKEYLEGELEAKGMGYSTLHNYARSNGISVKDKNQKQIINETLQAAGYKNLPQFSRVQFLNVHKVQLDKDSTELLEHTPETYRYNVPANRHHETVHRDAKDEITSIFLQNYDGTYSILADQANYKQNTRYANGAKGLILVP